METLRLHCPLSFLETDSFENLMKTKDLLPEKMFVSYINRILQGISKVFIWLTFSKTLVIRLPYFQISGFSRLLRPPPIPCFSYIPSKVCHFNNLNPCVQTTLTIAILYTFHQCLSPVQAVRGRGRAGEGGMNQANKCKKQTKALDRSGCCR